MSDELRFNLDLILISGIAAFHLALATPRTALAFFWNVFFNTVRCTVNLHPGSLMTRLPALFLTALSAQTLRCRFLQSIFGRGLGTVIAVLLMRQFLYLGSKFGYLFCQCCYLRILGPNEFIHHSELF